MKYSERMVTDMARSKEKDIHYLNASLDKRLYNEFSGFCKKMNLTKTAACEQAIRLYMDSMNKAMESLQKETEKNAIHEAIEQLK